MANVCISSGLTTDAEGHLTLDVGPWRYPCDPSEGYSQPIGLGEDGRAYAPPRQIVMTDRYGGTTPGFSWQGNVQANKFNREFELTVDNPDPCRRMHGIVILSIDIRANLEPNATVEVTAMGNVAWRQRNSAPRTMQMVNEFVRTLELSIEPGGSQTLSWRVVTDLVRGAGNIVAAYHVAQVIAVSSQPN